MNYSKEQLHFSNWDIWRKRVNKYLLIMDKKHNIILIYLDKLAI